MSKLNYKHDFAVVLHTCLVEKRVIKLWSIVSGISFTRKVLLSVKASLPQSKALREACSLLKAMQYTIRLRRSFASYFLCKHFALDLFVYILNYLLALNSVFLILHDARIQNNNAQSLMLIWLSLIIQVDPWQISKNKL